MNWKNLQNGLCPKCGAKLVMGLLDTVYPCTECDFSIGKEKFEYIAYGRGVNPMRHRELEDNLLALNNLGHGIISEDFSDSPHKDREL